jgi:hypothetical protein
MFSEVSGDKGPVLTRKLKLCSIVFDFSEGSGLESEKEARSPSPAASPPALPTHPPAHTSTDQAPALARPYRVHQRPQNPVS